MKAPKTNAARILDGGGIVYEMATYELDMSDFSAARVAEELGVDAGLVFKTLLVTGDRSGPVFAVIPSDSGLDLKALARVSGNRSMVMVEKAEIEKLTGYVRGCVTVLAAKRAYRVFVDETAEICDQIGVSGGAIGVQIFLGPSDYIRITAAEVSAIAR